MSAVFFEKLQQLGGPSARFPFFFHISYDEIAIWQCFVAIECLSSKLGDEKVRNVDRFVKSQQF